MSKILMIGLAMMLAAGWTARAEEEAQPARADHILQGVLQQRPQHDYALKGRLFVTRDQPVAMEILVKSGAEDTRTLYRTGPTELLIIQPIEGEPRWFLRGHGELTGAARMQPLLGSSITYYDLALPFLRWPATRYDRQERTRGRDCHVIEVAREGEPYARVALWIDKDHNALLRAEAFNEHGDLTKRFMITSFRRVGDAWIPRGTEFAFVPPGQSMPSQVRSRLDIHDGSEHAGLPDELFQPDRFARAAAPGE
jgi:hypothetical protein